MNEKYSLMKSIIHFCLFILSDSPAKHRMGNPNAYVPSIKNMAEPHRSIRMGLGFCPTLNSNNLNIITKSEI